MDNTRALRAVNITPPASVKGLRERLGTEASRRGKPITAVVGSIYGYAVKNRDQFAGPLKDGTGKRPGLHIGTSVDADVAKALRKWAKEEQSSRGLWCCYLLEMALEGEMLDEIFKKSQD